MEYYIGRNVVEDIAPTSAAAVNGIKLFSTNTPTGPLSHSVIITAISATTYVKFVQRDAAAPTLTSTDFRVVIEGPGYRSFSVAESIDVYVYSTGNVAGQRIG